jgi:hypothetical protein
MEHDQPRPIDAWSRDELISAVESLLAMNVAAMEVVYYIQGKSLDIDDELLRRIQRLAGAYYLAPPLPGE